MNICALMLFSGPRSIAISQDGKRLAVADPRARVAVFDTEKMDLLCTILQGTLCKHIALYHSSSDTRLGTSILNENNSSRETLWFIENPNPHTSLLNRCLNALRVQDFRYVNKQTTV